MGEKRRFLDVWIVESNTVYREVPYTVVTDWVQQGRLLDEDRLRNSGTNDWQRLGDVPAFAAFLPKVEPHRVEDQAEALEPVVVDFAWKKRNYDADDDVDMIPLIDISLVLLIFFMMTAAVGGAGTLIPTPQARYHLVAMKPQVFWVGITKGNDEQPEYSYGRGDETKEEHLTNRQKVIEGIGKLLEGVSGPAEISIRAHLRLPYEEVRDMTTDLGRFERAGKVTQIYAEVSEKEAS
jgi:biopolymer transport protein ExbD